MNPHTGEENILENDPEQLGAQHIAEACTGDGTSITVEELYKCLQDYRDQRASIEYTTLDDSENLQRLGLPTSFGSKKRSSRNPRRTRQRENSPKFNKQVVETHTTTSSMYMGCEASSDTDTTEDLESEMSEIKDLDENGASASKSDELNELPKRRRVKKRALEKEPLPDENSLPQSVRDSEIISKYYTKRFSLFSRFDEGIQLDEESWFSVTPEKIAEHIALRLNCGTMLDAFCGSGGNAIQFAFTCDRVIAIDLDPEKINLARNNARVYGVENKIDFIIGDFFKIGQQIKADTVFLSPPWGGPDYAKIKPYDIEKKLLPQSASFLLTYTRKISKNIALYVPRNTNNIQLTRIAGAGNSVEIENNYLNRKFIAKTAYLGDTIDRSLLF